MNFRMSPKRWFWSLMGITLLWSGLGNRWREADASIPSPMRRFQSGLSQPFLFLLVPAQFIFTGIEGIATSAIDRVTSRHDGSVSVEALQEQIQDLQAQKAQLGGLLAEASERLGAIEKLPSFGLSPGDVLPANILGYQAGPGASLLHLDKGAQDGVRRGMVVVAPLEQVTVLGLVGQVNAKECEVRLLSDPSMKVNADIVRPDSAVRIASQSCLIEGLGSNLMQCETLDKQQPGNPPSPRTRRLCAPD